MKAHKIEISVVPTLAKPWLGVPDAELSSLTQARLDALPLLNNAPKAVPVVDQPARKKTVALAR